MRQIIQKLWIFIVILCVSIPASAHDFVVNGIYYTKTSSNEVAVTYRGNTYDQYSNEYKGSITIPASVKYNNVTYNVTTIDGYTFYNCTSLTSINIPNSVTSIGYRAFYNCTSLSSINIPNSVTSIDEYTFYNCSSLASVNIPTSVTSIDQSTFQNCSSLSSINIPNSVTSIGYQAFRNCTSLTSVNLPNSVTSIGESAFFFCNSLTSVNIPDFVTSIEHGTFGHCISLVSVNIPKSVTSIDGAFYDCTSLTSIDIPNSVTSIDGAFYDCTSLVSVNIPNSVTSIGSNTFNSCTSLTSIDIPNSVTTIGNNAFYGCSALKTIDIPNSVSSIDKKTFYNCTSLEKVILPNSIKTLGESAFTNCMNLKSITLPYGINEIQENCFSSCPNLSTPIIGLPESTDTNNAIILPPTLSHIGKGNFTGVKNVVVLFNNEIEWDLEGVKTLLTLDSNKPTFTLDNLGKCKYYVCNKEKFITDTNCPSKYVFQLDGENNNIEFDYIGEPQTLNQEALHEGYIDYIKSIGIVCQFKNEENIDCGYYQGIGHAIFSYGGWSIESEVPYDYTIKPVLLQVIPKDASRIYGDLNPKFNFELNGLVGRDKDKNVEDTFIEFPTITSTATESSAVGDYPISISGGKAKNYVLSYRQGTLNISKAPLSVIANDAEKVYGDNNPKFSRSYLGVKLDETESSIFSQLPTITCSATKTSDVGEYDIEVSGGNTNNYEIIEYIPGTFTIEKAR